MTIEEFKKALDKAEYMFGRCRIRDGLNLIAKYNPKSDLSAIGHDIVYVEADIDDLSSKISSEDAIQLGSLGWFIDEEHESLAHYV